jgi:hypothetical protein
MYDFAQPHRASASSSQLRSRLKKYSLYRDSASLELSQQPTGFGAQTAEAPAGDQRVTLMQLSLG